MEVISSTTSAINVEGRLRRRRAQRWPWSTLLSRPVAGINRDDVAGLSLVRPGELPGAEVAADRLR
jgi:hypothetical protein